MGVGKIEYRDVPWEKQLIKQMALVETKLTTIQNDMAEVKVDLAEVKENTKKEIV